MMLGKIAGILMLVWFYQTGKQYEDNPVKWAIIGLVGYWLVWWLVTLTIANPILTSLPRNAVTGYLLVSHMPAVVGVVAAIFIRLKLLKDLAKQ